MLIIQNYRLQSSFTNIFASEPIKLQSIIAPVFAIQSKLQVFYEKKQPSISNSSIHPQHFPTNQMCFPLRLVQLRRITLQLVRITSRRQQTPQDRAVLAIVHRQCHRIHHTHRQAQPTRTAQLAHKSNTLELSICYLNFLVISRMTEASERKKNTKQMRNLGHLEQCMVSSIQE